VLTSQAGFCTPILVLTGAYPDQVDQFFDNSFDAGDHALASLKELDLAVHSRQKGAERSPED